MAKKPAKLQERRVKALGRPPKALSELKKSIPEFYIPPVTSSEDLSSEAETMLGASSSGTDTDWETSMSFPELSLSCGVSDDSAQCLTSGDITVADDFVAGYFDSHEQAQLPFFDIETIIPIDADPCAPGDKDKDALTEAERTELYNLIDTNIPLALEQSVGTYQSFMAERSQSYFDHLLPVLRRPRASRLVTNVATTTVATEPAPSAEVPDIRNWFWDDLDSNKTNTTGAYNFAESGDGDDINRVDDLVTNNGLENNSLEISQSHPGQQNLSHHREKGASNSSLK